MALIHDISGYHLAVLLTIFVYCTTCIQLHAKSDMMRDPQPARNNNYYHVALGKDGFHTLCKDVVQRLSLRVRNRTLQCEMMDASEAPAPKTGNGQEDASGLYE